MQDDDIAYGAAQMLFCIDDIMANHDITVWMTPEQMMEIFRRRNALANTLRAYREIYGFDEPRTPRAHPKTVMATQTVRMSAGALALGGMGGGAAMSRLAVTDAAGAALIYVAAFAFFNALDDSPHPDYAKEASAVKDSVIRLTQDFADLQSFSSMAMTAEDVGKATVKQLKDALIAAIESKQFGLVNLIVEELIRRFPRCATAIQAMRQKYVEYTQLKNRKTYIMGASAAIAKAGNLTRLLAELRALVTQAMSCIGP
jgi:hypothetical protein